MQGEHVSIWLYARGYAARDLPYQLWRLIEDAGDWGRIILEDGVQDSRVSKFGDLTHWIDYMSDKTWLLIADNATGDICGLGWFSDRRGDTALSSIWMAPGWRGKPHSREAIKLGVEFGYKELGLKTIQSITPWPLARNLARRAGFKVVCQIPKHFGADVWLLEHKRVEI
jgi:RimJ/RimL family protein N-acetyltransferase